MQRTKCGLNLPDEKICSGSCQEKLLQNPIWISRRDKTLEAMEINQVLRNKDSVLSLKKDIFSL